MGENFSVVPSALNALSGYTKDLGEGAEKTVQYAQAFTVPSNSDFTGLVLPQLFDPLVNLASSTATRWSVLEKDLSDTSTGLSAAAWQYFTQDSQNARKLSSGGTPQPSAAPDAPGPLNLGTPSELSLIAPPHPEVDTRSIAEAAADWLADCNDAIERLTGWDPIGEALHQIAGNWMALKSIGGAYETAGNALGQIAGDLSKSSGQVDPYWNGRAALEFNDYSSKLSRGLEWEASVGRLLNRGLSMAADELNKAAIEAVRLIKEGLSRLVKFDSFSDLLKLAAKAVPYAGQVATGIEVAKLIDEVRGHVMPLIDEIKRGVDAFMAFLDFLKDPAGAAKSAAEQSIESRLAPYRERLEKGQQASRDLQDVATAVDVTRYMNRPEAGYDVGDPRRMREDG